MRRLFRIWRARPDPSRELEDELAHHFDETRAELESAGLDPAAAASEAERRFGPVERWRRRIEVLDRARERGVRRRERLQDMSRHVTAAVRGVRRAPGFAAAVVATLGLGIGANSTIFGVVDRLLLSPPPGVRDADRVAHLLVDRVSPFTRARATSGSLSWPDLEDFRDVEAFASVGGFSASERTLGRGEGAERIRIETATASYFPTLGARTALGRFFTADEDRPTGVSTPPVVLSHAFWRARFSGDPGVLGRELEIGDLRYTVVGVAERGFVGATSAPVDAWLPLLTTQGAESPELAWQESRRWYFLGAVARLAPSATPEAAAQEATAAHRAGRGEEIAADRYSADARVVLGSLVPGRSPVAGDEVSVARWLALVAGLVLLLACANVTNLFLGRAVRRRRETAVRVALGVDRGRLVAALGVEALLLSLLGAAAALGLAWLGGGLLARTLLADLYAPTDGLDLRLVAFTLGAATLTALLVALVPALRATRADPAVELQGRGGAAAGRSRLRSLLTVAQAAISVLLLVGAGLLVRSFAEAARVDLGFEPEPTLLARVEPSTGGLVERSRIQRRTLPRLEAAPGIAEVAAAGLAPLFGKWGVEVRVPGRDSIDFPGVGPVYYPVSARFFEATGIDVVRGRGFTGSDDVEGAPATAVVSARLAREVWGREDAVGECLLVGPGSDGPPPCTTVVGLVEDIRDGPGEEAVSALYLPLHHPEALRAGSGEPPAWNLVVRAEGGDAGAVAGTVRRILLSEAGVRYVSVEPYRLRVAPAFRAWRLGATLFGLFGALALAVAALGLFSVVSFEVAQRRTELGIRAALGASGAGLLGLVLRRALGMAGLGLVLGLGGALAVGPLMDTLLFRVAPFDPVVYVGVAAALLAVAALAALAPALRARRADPGRVLRAE